MLLCPLPYKRPSHSMKGSILTVSAPSGAGKTSLLKQALLSLSDISLSISHTTRPKREDECDGKDYFFVKDKATFDLHVAEGHFLEYAEVFGHYYGTHRETVDRELEQGKDVILEIDWQGAEQVRECADADVVSIFIAPPSFDVLCERLQGRGTDTEQVIATRLAQAKADMQKARCFDYVIVNDDFDKAVAAFIALVTSLRLRGVRQSAAIDGMLETFPS